MEETSVTATTIISFAKTLEDNSATFYEELAPLLPAHKDRLLGYARECRKNKTLVVRTYQETISDALEAGFSFEGFKLQDYGVGQLSTKGLQPAKAVAAAVDLEEKAIAFYTAVAAQCQSLLATIPRAFLRVADGRKKRLAELQTMH